MNYIYDGKFFMLKGIKITIILLNKKTDMPFNKLQTLTTMACQKVKSKPPNKEQFSRQLNMD